jgi:hypothetical protein
VSTLQRGDYFGRGSRGKEHTTVEVLALSNLAGGCEFFISAGKTKARVPDEEEWWWVKPSLQ